MKKIAFIAALPLFFGSESFAADSTLENSKSEKRRNYYVKAKSFGSAPESDPPQYVAQLNETDENSLKEIDWIDLGLRQRTRFEYRDNDFRRSVDNVDNPVLSRTQIYFGIKNIIDPLRFAFEIQDSRRFNGKFPKDNGDINKLDIFQAYTELYFKKPLAFDRPISLRAGRMSFEVLDRKLFARDEWGNTGNNFQGYRAIIGEQISNWQFDNFALQPMTELMSQNDNVNKDQWIYASILSWRKFSDFVTLQPFYFKLDQKKSATSFERKIHSPGLRFYGDILNTNFDYDIIGVYQFGSTNSENHLASAYATEIGYTYDYDWKIRQSIVYSYASGDKNPYDNKNQRFERFYGFARAWSSANTVDWENLETIKNRIELNPTKKIKIDSSYSFYWLASSTDKWNRTGLQDKTGKSGNFMGQDFDFRLGYQFSKKLNATIGYDHFIPGSFARKVGRDGSSDFIYLELTFSAF